MQNANQGPAIDADPFNVEGIGYTSNTQVDNAGVDVRLTQLRNLLAGTRPQPTPGVPGLKAGVLSPVNGDNNFVLIGGILYYMPNNVADPNDVVFGTDAKGNHYVQRLNPPVAGRWGEADSVSGGIDAPNAPNQINGYVNLVQDSFTNPVRAGYSFGIADLLNGAPCAAADDNYNQFDPFPIGHTGELNDRDFFDSAGGLMLPVDRMRRFVTPVDIDGSGRALRWGVPWPEGDVGADAFGRVDFAGYFRPPGAPGLISLDSGGGATPGAIVYPGNDLFYTSGPNPANLAFPLYLPDVSNNPLHGFEAAKNPNLPDAHGNYSPQGIGGMPADVVQDLAKGIPDRYPTYDLNIRTNGLNEADEMNLYVPNAQLDAPFGYGDLEWLYRQQDVDGGSLVSRLAQLAPVSFSNTIDGQRRRRLFALDSWEIEQVRLGQRQPPVPTTGHHCAVRLQQPLHGDCQRRLHHAERPGVHQPQFSAHLHPRHSQPDLPAVLSVPRPHRWHTATRRSTSIIRSRFPTLPTSQSARSGSARRISFSRQFFPPGPSILRKSWPSSASS